MFEQRFKLQISLNNADIKQNVFHEMLLMAMAHLTWFEYIPLCAHHSNINNDRHNLVCLTEKQQQPWLARYVYSQTKIVTAVLIVVRPAISDVTFRCADYV